MKRFRLYLFNTVTKERKRALAKGADQLDEKDANRLIRLSRKMKSEWEYRKEEINKQKDDQ